MADDVSIVVRVRDATRAGITSVNQSLNRLARQTSEMDKSFGSMRGAALSLAPALIPIAAATAPIAVATSAAAVAVGAFGAAIIPQAQAMGEAAEAEKKYTDAVEEHGKSSKEATQAEKAYLQQVAKLPPATRQAAASLSVLKDQYKEWSNSLAGDTMPVATKGFAVLGALFPKLTPTVKGAAVELDRFMTIVAGGMASPGFDRFMAKFNEFAVSSLAKANSGVVRLTQSLDSGQVGGALSEFMQYAKDNGPLVGDTLKNLAEALTKLLIAASDTGVGMLTVINAFSRLVAAIPTELLTRLLQIVVVFKAIRIAAAGMAVVATHLARAGAAAAMFTRAAQFGGVGAAIGGVTQRLSAMQKATGVLGVLALIVLSINELGEKAKGAPPDVDKLATSLKNLGEAGKFTGELRKTFGDMDGFVAKVNQMRQASTDLDAAKPFTSLLPGAAGMETIARKLEGLSLGTKSLAATKDDLKAFDDSFAQLATSGHADEAASQFKRFEAALRATGMSTREIKDLFPEYQAALASIKAEQELAARGMGLFGEQALATKAKLDAQKQSTDGLRMAIQALNDVNRQALGGMVGFEAAIDAAAKSAKDNAGALKMVNGELDLDSEKSRNAAAALSDLAAKTDEAAAAARDNGASWSTVNGIYSRGREQLIASAQAMGLTEAQAKTLADQILQIPDKTATFQGDITDLKAKIKDAQTRLKNAPMNKKAAIRAEIAALKQDLAKAQAAINRLHGTTITSHHYLVKHYDSIEDFRGAHGRAHGGIIGAAGGGPRSRMTLVGEQGPELVDLAPGSRVRSNPDTRRMLGGGAGGGGGPQVIEVPLYLDGREIARAIIDPLRTEIRGLGGNVQSAIGQRGRG